ARARKTWARGALFVHHADADDVSLTIHRLDDLRSACIIAENLPQTADAHIDAAIEWIGIAPAQQLGELRACQHAIAGAEKYREQPVLGAAQRHLATVGVPEGAGHGVEPPAAKGEPTYGVGARIARRVRRAAQHCLDATEQLPRVEGLGDIVVGAELETAHPIDVLAPPGPPH